MEVRPLISVEEIIQEATAFYYFYLPVLAPSCDPHSITAISEARAYCINIFPIHQLAQNIFVAKVGHLARKDQSAILLNTGKPYRLEYIWLERLESTTKVYNEYLREVRSSPEFLRSLMDEDCCSCTLRCMPDPEPCPSTTDLV